MARLSAVVTLVSAVFLQLQIVSAASFQPAQAGYQYSFPRDHGPHPTYQTEWWYYTGHLSSAGGRRFGYQVTFFRVGLVPDQRLRASRWGARDIVLAHLALTDITNQRFYFADRVERASLGLAGATGGALPHIWLGGWDLRFKGQRGLEQHLHAAAQCSGSRTAGVAVDLGLASARQPVIHGVGGVSSKGPGASARSHYYSFTRLRTSGILKLDNSSLRVTGQSWFDHEFGSNQLSRDLTGWDWFSVQLTDGRELMLYRLRGTHGTTLAQSSGTLVEASGAFRHLRLAEFSVASSATWSSPRSGAVYPSRWSIRLPGEGLTLQLIPDLADQELDTSRSTGVRYWEGSVSVRSANGLLVGKGYVELTGYAGHMRRDF